MRRAFALKIRRRRLRRRLGALRARAFRERHRDRPLRHWSLNKAGLAAAGIGVVLLLAALCVVGSLSVSTWARRGLMPPPRHGAAAQLCSYPNIHLSLPPLLLLRSLPLGSLLALAASACRVKAWQQVQVRTLAAGCGRPLRYSWLGERRKYDSLLRQNQLQSCTSLARSSSRSFQTLAAIDYCS